MVEEMAEAEAEVMIAPVVASAIPSTLAESAMGVAVVAVAASVK